MARIRDRDPIGLTVWRWLGTVDNGLETVGFSEQGELGCRGVPEGDEDPDPTAGNSDLKSAGIGDRNDLVGKRALASHDIRWRSSGRGQLLLA